MNFQEIESEQLHRVIEKRDLVSPETVIILLSTNELRTTTNVDFVVGKRKFPKCILVPSGVLRLRDVSWWRFWALNDRFVVNPTLLGLNLLIQTPG